MNKFLPLLLLLSVLQNLAAGTYHLTFGSKYEEAPPAESLFVDQWGNPLDPLHPGLLAAGYFEDGFDLDSAVQNIQTSGFSSILSAFNALDSKDSLNVHINGFLESSAFINGLGVGKTPYLLLLSGVTTLEDASLATGVGLFTDSSYDPIPAGSDPFPQAYFLNLVKYDTVILGTETPKGGEFPGHSYGPVSLGVPPPALSNSENLTSAWWHNDWFGAFYMDPNSPWIFHETIGWVFPNALQPDTPWFWEGTLDSWLFVSSGSSPYLWSDSLGLWTYPYRDSGSLKFMRWDPQANQWILP